MEANVRALRARAPAHDALRRYAEIARLATGSAQAGADEAVRWARGLVASLEILPLSHFGLTNADVPAIVAAAANASSMKANPLPLNTAELTEILVQSL
jgi:alcohol dehydrogenase class IV